MPWGEISSMDLRAQFVLDALEPGFTMSGLCEQYGISRKTGYKWLARYRAGGRPGCADQPRAPKRHPNATPEKIEARIVRFRKKHPSWGPITIHRVLTRDYPHVTWPRPATIADILKRNELVRKRRKRKPKAPWQTSRTRAEQPNQVWTADFKGQFRLGNGRLCYPLTIADAHSRYLLVCKGLRSTSLQPVRQVFEAAFREYGLPEVIHTDNGVPFCAPGALLGLSSLSVWFLKLGIRLQRSRPGHPQDNGAHERMHRTLKAEAARPARRTEAAQQRALNAFRKTYNEKRPHHALQLDTPAEHYVKSSRRLPRDLEDPVYPAHFQVRYVTRIGVFWWHSKMIFLTNALRNQAIGLECVADGEWLVFFGDVLLGTFLEKEGRVVTGTRR